MNIIDDLPFYIVIIGVLLNIVIGLTTHISFTELMIRSIIVTIAFSVIGYLLSSVLGSALKTKKEKERKSNHSEKDTNAENTSAGSAGQSKDNQSTLDIRVPPIDDEEFLNYGDIDEDEFVEMSPAYLHKSNQQNHDE